MKRFLTGCFLMALGAATFAGGPTPTPATKPAPVTAAATKTSEEYSYSTYKEQVGEFTLLAYSLPAFYRVQENFFPLVIAVGRIDEKHKKGESREAKKEAEKSILVHLGNFQLTDLQGNRYSPADPELINTQYKYLMEDKNVLETEPMVTTGLFEESGKMNVAFYPVKGGGRLRANMVEMETFTAFESAIYFQQSKAGLGGILTLTLGNDQINPPLSVRFKLPVEHQKKHKEEKPSEKPGK